MRFKIRQLRYSRRMACKSDMKTEMHPGFFGVHFLLDEAVSTQVTRDIVADSYGPFPGHGRQAAYSAGQRLVIACAHADGAGTDIAQHGGLFCGQLRIVFLGGKSVNE